MLKLTNLGKSFSCLLHWYVSRFLIGAMTMAILSLVIAVVFLPFMTCFDLTGKCAERADTSDTLPDFITVPMILLFMPLLGGSTVHLVRSLQSDR